MAHYDCSCCGEAMGISHTYCPECKAGNCRGAPMTTPEELLRELIDGRRFDHGVVQISQGLYYRIVAALEARPEGTAGVGETDLIRRVEYILDPSASAQERLARRSHLTNHDLRRILTALSAPDQGWRDIADAPVQTCAAFSVLAERERQKAEEGWTPEHDDEHATGELAAAAACYAVGEMIHQTCTDGYLWPWSEDWWKPGDRRRELVKAGALILAEIERLDRTSLLPLPPKDQARG